VLFRSKKIMAASIFMYSLSPFCAAFATSLPMFVFFRSTTFIGVCVEFVAAITWLAEVFPDKKDKEKWLGITQAFMQDERFSTRGAQIGLSEWALRELLAAGKTVNGRNLPITLAKVENTIATKRYEGRIQAGLPRRAPEYTETIVRRKRLANLAKARQALAAKRLAEERATARKNAKAERDAQRAMRGGTFAVTAREAIQRMAAPASYTELAATHAPTTDAPAPVTLQDIFQLAELLVSKIKLLDQKLVGALR
jgi:hypothetical protein